MTQFSTHVPHRALWKSVRRVSIGIALIATLDLAWTGTNSTVTLNVKDFGAKGDGVADDYAAMQAAATGICSAPGATLVYPPGVYRIDRYRVKRGPLANNIQDIRYVGCKGNTIIGNGAQIYIKGNFRRSADHSEKDYAVSDTDTVVPFVFIKSSGFHLIGFEINGNVSLMRRDEGVIEGTGTGILTTNCEDYSIEHVFVHHFPTDGITMGGNSELADQRVRLDHVKSDHNARNGLSIVQARQVTIVDSVFTYNGFPGAYGNHAPAAGVDVEPVRHPPQEDVYTGLITFDNCRFEENAGSQFVSGWPEEVESITVKNSYIKATITGTRATAFMNVPRTGVTSNNTFELAAGHWVALAVLRADQYGAIAHLTYSGNTFHLGDNKGILAPVRQAPVDLVDNDIRVENAHADSNPLRLDYLNLIESNRFFVASSGYSNLPFHVVYEHGNGTVRKNSYDTDRSGPGHFSVSYGSQITTSDETFPNSASFKPVHQDR